VYVPSFCTSKEPKKTATKPMPSCIPVTYWKTYEVPNYSKSLVSLLHGLASCLS
jgi:hypothetical protein